jgi:hypothetical protein
VIAENAEHGEEPNESAWNEEAVEGQLEELEDEELAELEDDEQEGLDDV